MNKEDGVIAVCMKGQIRTALLLAGLLCAERLGDRTKSWIEIKIYGPLAAKRVLVYR